jgi:hypothetical protein
MENAGRKLPPMQKQGQIDIEDAVRKGQTAWSNRSNVKCEPFRKIGPAYPALAVGGALTDFSADDKFVKELAEPIPLGEVTVLTRRHRPTMHLMAQTPSKACVFHLVRKIGDRRAAWSFGDVEDDG